MPGRRSNRGVAMYARRVSRGVAVSYGRSLGRFGATIRRINDGSSADFGHDDWLPPRPSVRLLGPIEIAVGEEWQQVRGARRCALVAAIALRAGEIVPADELVEIMWPDDGAPATAANSLQSHVSFLRREFGLYQHILSRAPGYLLDLAGGSTDVQVVERTLLAARQAHPRVGALMLHDALSRWQGSALANLRDHLWFADHASRLDQLRDVVTRELIDIRLDLGEHGLVVAELEAHCQQHPFDEHLHAQLMVARYRCGKQRDALEVYQRLRRRLDGELGVEPGPRVRQIEAAILRHEPWLDLEAGSY